MIKKIILMCMAMCTAAAMAQQQLDRLPVVIDLQGVSLAQVVHLVYKEISPSSYVMAPDLVADQRAVSLRRGTGDPARLPGFMDQWLKTLGYATDDKAGRSLSQSSNRQTLRPSRNPKKP